MPTDRGGLAYKIEVIDAFSKAIADFKKGMTEAKASFKAFKDSAKNAKESSTAIKQNTKAVDENRNALKRLDADSKARAKQERTLNQLRASLRRDEKRQIAEVAALQKKASADNLANLRAEQRRIKEVFDARNRAEREAARISAQMRKDEARDLAKRQRDIQTFAQASQRAEREAAKISASLKRDQQKQRDLDPQFQAQKRNLAILKEEAIVRAQIAQIRARTGKQLAAGDLIGASKSVQQIKDLNRSLESTDRSARNLFFTFRRLVGILAVFTIARNVVQGFQDMVSAGLRFNDNIIEATTSIAGLISAVGDVRDEFGESVDASKELALAQIIARKQVELLRQDALRTTASFEQLAQTFQVAVAPGFAAGLNIDEIRELTVQVSQAAAAIGLEQNQLAEEVRSLLSGTIQARTTRIATALGITNADVRRLRESGELFTFLQQKLEAFDKAAQEVARSTLAGISNLAKGAFGKILGDAAGPLFQNLLKLGNELFDKVLTIKDAAGKIQPNPQLVNAFRIIFDTLSEGVSSLRDLATDLGFKGLEQTFKAAGAALTAAIQFSIGFAQALLKTLQVIVGVISGIGDVFGLTTKEIGRVAGAIGVALAASLVWKNTLGQIGLGFGNIGGFVRALIPSLDQFLLKLTQAGGAAAVIGANIRRSILLISGFAAATAIVLKGFELIAQAILGIDLNLKETVQIISLGILGGLVQAIGFFQKLGLQVINFFKEGFRTISEGAAEAAADTKIFTTSLLGNQKEVEALVAKRDKTLIDQDNAKRIRDAQFLVELKDKETQLAAKLLGIQQEIANIAGEAAGKNAQGEKFDPNFDLDAFLKANAAVRAGKKGFQEFVPIISTSAKVVEELANELFDLELELRKTAVELANANKFGGLEGVSGQIQGVFSERDVKLGEDLRKIQEQIAQNARDINTANARGNRRYHERLTLGEDTGKQDAKSIALRTRLAELASEDKQDQALILSLHRDQAFLEESKLDFERTSLELAIRKAAIIAAQVTPGLNLDNAATSAELANQRELLQLQLNRTDARIAAVVIAQSEIDLTKKQLQASRQLIQVDLAKAQQLSAESTGEEKIAFDALIAAKEKQLKLEIEIGKAKIASLEATKAEAELVLRGTEMQGIKRGFEEIAQELPTAFQRGITLAKGFVTELGGFIKGVIRSAFDPNNDQTLAQRFGAFLQGIGDLLLDSIINAALADVFGKTEAAAVEATGATTAALIRNQSAAALTTASEAELTNAIAASFARSASAGAIGGSHGGLVTAFAKGGPVPDFSSVFARAQGLAGGGKPRHIPASDTVPAWLTPGEFVIRKRQVDRFGVDFFKSLNRGSFEVPRARGAGPSHDFARGMAAGGTVSGQNRRRDRSGGSDETLQILPVHVAGERELARQLAGGKAAFLRHLRENASAVQSIVQRRS